MPHVYLDHAATTPVRPQAHAALSAWSQVDAGAGNASSSHAAGRRARTAIEEARERIATVLGAAPHDIVFTSGGTEGDNLAVKGIAWAAAESGRRHLVTSAVEHPAVRDAIAWLADHQGFTVTIVGVAADGRVEVERVLDAVREDTALVSVMTANNELGAINDVAAMGTAIRARGVAFHTDAVQAFATLDVAADAVDALSLSAHKFGGPGGVGVAYLRRGVPVTPLAHGGQQDRGVRSGTFATALDAACAAAIETAALDRPRMRSDIAPLADRLAAGLLDLDGVTRNGPASPEQRLLTHVHVSLDGVDGEALTFALDRAGLAVSAGAACSSGAARASHVLEAAGVQGDAAVRFSLGWTTTSDDIDRALDITSSVVTDLRRVGGGAVA